MYCVKERRDGKVRELVVRRESSISGNGILDLVCELMV